MAAFRLSRFAPMLILALGVALSGCTFPVKQSMQMPDQGVIRTVQTADGRELVLPPDCAALLQPSRLDKPGDQRPSIAFGCATYTNMAHTLARPQDLTRPASYAGQSAHTAGTAVQRYLGNAVTPLSENSSMASPEQ